MIKEMTLEEFEVIKSQGSIVVEFFTSWCGDCHMMEPTYQNLSNEYNNTVFVKVNAEDADVFQKEGGYNILAVPTFIFYKDGEEVGRAVEYNPIDKLKELVEKTL